MDADIIGGFPFADPNCKGCGKPLYIGNAWITDGCPCNCPLGTNSMNETRWRLLMQLQQQQLTDARQQRRETASLLRDVRVGVAYSAEYVRGELDRIANALERT